MRYRDGRRSVCVSSQSGCPLTCTFCATGTMKFGRNLTASEILDQVLHFRRIEPVDHLVFMGMGEPMMNLDNVLAAARGCPTSASPTAAPRSRRSAGCRASSGWPRPTCRSASRSRCTRPTTRCARRSCRSTTATRSPTCSPPARRYYERRRRKVFIEYVMLAGVNDRYAQARRSSRELLDPRIYKVNLIPYNPTGLATTAPRAARSPRSRPCSRSTGCARRCASRAAATSTPPAGSSRRRPAA